ncbi:MAG: PIG-L family deacetylase [Verrucomicrobia bacterium]|nr:PIG-L family deacetylase [Verrucomicrobiota bacterium]
MKFTQAAADEYVPDGLPPVVALAQVTHLCIAAHQDDIEIMAHAGIVDCLETSGKWFGGVVVTDGAGSPRTGPYAGYIDEKMKEVRRDEQRRAAKLGRYGIQIQLAHSSAAVKSVGASEMVRQDLTEILSGCKPEVVYLHNPADKHDTHIGVLLRSLEVLRALPKDRQPRLVLGCEVWRDLDWLLDADKVALDAGRRPELAAEMLKAFDSQIAGGKRYDLATAGRRLANATFHTSHATDRLAGITWAMDLTPLVKDATQSVREYMLGYIDRLKTDVAARLERFG